MTPYVVVIPSRNADNLRVCLGAYRATPENTVVVWDGDAIPPSREGWAILGSQPFNYARNCNTGIRWAGDQDIILLNDDCVLETPDGFDMLSQAAQDWPHFGVIVPQVRGVTSCREQRYDPLRCGSEPPRRALNHSVPFMCAYLRREVLNEVGPVDEDDLLDDQGLPLYTGEDDLYCARLRKAGYFLAILDSVVVEHGSLPSSFRTNADGTPREIPCGPSRELYVRKMGALPE